MDLLERGAAWLNEQRHAHLTGPVTYRRGGQSVELAATRGRTEFQQTDAEGVLHRWESRDFLIRTADLVLGGTATPPAAGDQIVADDEVFEVVAPGDEPPYRYTDAYRLGLRIHTKLIDRT